MVRVVFTAWLAGLSGYNGHSENSSDRAGLNQCYRFFTFPDTAWGRVVKSENSGNHLAGYYFSNNMGKRLWKKYDSA